MKRLSADSRERLIRLSRYCEARRNRRQGKKRVQSKARYVAPGDVIKAPKSFDLVHKYGLEVVKFLRAVSRQVLVNKKNVRLNFKDTEHFVVPGAILLFAELDRIINMSELPKPISIKDPMRRRPREVLKQIGLYNLTGDSCDIVPEREDVVYWKATKGNSQSGDAYGPLIEAIAERANREHAHQLVASGVWRGVNEAIANSVDHAYKKPRYDGFLGLAGTKWWMFSQIKNGVFSLAVCDLGCGYRQTINDTIPEKFIAAFQSTFKGTNRDSFAIDIAMEYGRTGTHEVSRGKGSRDALSLLKKHGDGEMAVLSNTGLMRYVYENGQERSRLDGDLGIDIGGTVVWWKLPLKESSNAVN
jgi:hypothetical protein